MEKMYECQNVMFWGRKHTEEYGSNNWRLKDEELYLPHQQTFIIHPVLFSSLFALLLPSVDTTLLPCLYKDEGIIFYICPYFKNLPFRVILEASRSVVRTHCTDISILIINSKAYTNHTLAKDLLLSNHLVWCREVFLQRAQVDCLDHILIRNSQHAKGHLLCVVEITRTHTSHFYCYGDFYWHNILLRSSP